MANSTTKSETPDKSEKVKVNLFRDRENYKGDVFVAVNGKHIQIKRGVTVEIDKKYAEVLEHQHEQDADADDYAAQASAEFEAESKARGL